MTTDNKAVARWDAVGPDMAMDESSSGAFILFTDHERVVGDEVEHRRRWFVRAGEYLSRAQAAERSASRSAEECLFLRSQRPLARKLTEAEAEIETLRTELSASRAELDALNEAQAVGDGTISGSLLHWHQRALAAESDLAESRAEVEGLKKDAERYRWLRDHAGKDEDQVEIFIEQESYAPGHLDAQVDAAMEKGNV